MSIKNRIKEIVQVKASDLAPHPQNWRVHSAVQKSAMSDILRTLGAADVIKAYRRQSDGKLMILDGHLRADLDPDYVWNVVVLDFTDEEAKQFLATYDPITDMAVENQEILEALLKETIPSSAGMESILKQLGDRFNVPWFIDGAGMPDLNLQRPDYMQNLSKKSKKFQMLTCGELGCLVPTELYNRIVEVCSQERWESNQDALLAILASGASENGG